MRNLEDPIVRKYYVREAKRAYNTQRHHSRKRGILFLLTFKEWFTWWEQQLGPNFLDLRGKVRGKYVMGRKRDRGPYTLGNIECITCSKNHMEWPNNKKRKHRRIRLGGG